MNSSAAPEDPAAGTDTYQYPYRPPVDREGEVIGDIPWKFFEPPGALRGVDPLPVGTEDIRRAGVAAHHAGPDLE